MKAILKKTIVFVLPLIILLVFVNVYQHKTKSLTLNKNGIYFVGSSRVQNGINNTYLNNCTNTPVYNLGVRASTFLHNYILSKELIKKRLANKLFIELSVIRHDYLPHQEQLGISPSVYIKYLTPKTAFNYTEQFLFSKLSLMHSIKKNFNISEEANIGYNVSSENKYLKTDSFLKLEDLSKTYHTDISEYKQFIKELVELAENNNIKIHFFLPLTFNSQQERATVARIYNWLPQSLKVKYSKTLISNISKPTHLTDKNHLNQKGATIWTHFFCENL